MSRLNIQSGAFITDGQQMQGNSRQSRITQRSPQGQESTQRKQTTIDEDINNLQHDIRHLEKRLNENSPRTINSMNILRIKPHELKMATHFEFSKYHQGSGIGDYLAYLFDVKSKLYSVAKERKQMIKRDIQSFKGELEIDYSSLKFKPVSTSQQEIQYQTQNVMSFDYMNEKLKKKEEKQLNHQKNLLIDMFKREFEHRRYQEKQKETEELVQKRKLQEQKKYLKPIVQRNKQCQEVIKKHKQKLKDEEEEYEEKMDQYLEKQERRMESLMEKKEQEKLMRQSKLSQKTFQSNQHSKSLLGKIQEDEYAKIEELKLKLDIKQSETNLMQMEIRMEKENKIRQENLQKLDKYQRYKQITQETEKNQIQRLGQSYSSGELAYAKRQQKLKQLQKDYTKNNKLKLQRFKQQQEANQRQLERKEDKLQEIMERKMRQLEKLNEEREFVRQQREQNLQLKAQQNLINLEKRQHRQNLKADKYMFKNENARDKIEQLKYDKELIKSMSMGTTLRNNYEMQNLNRKLMPIKNYTKEQLLKKIRELELDETEFQEYFKQKEEIEEQLI